MPADRQLQSVPTPHATPHAASALVEGRAWAGPLAEALHGLMAEASSPPDLVLVFAAGHDAREYPAIVNEVHCRTSAGTLIGCSSRGVVGDGLEIEQQPAVSLVAMWLPGADLRPIRLHQEHVELFNEPDLWHEVHDTTRHPDASWLVIAEPYRIDAQAVIEGFARLYPRNPIVGGLAAANAEDRKSWIFIDNEVYEEGGVAIAFTPPYAIAPFVSHGCEPVGQAWTITGTERNVILSISNRAAIDVYRQTVESVADAFDIPATHRVVAGFAVDEYQDEFHCGDFIVRGILGMDERRGGIAVGGRPRVAQTIQFHVRNPETADVELHQMLAEARAATGDVRIVAGLLCTCAGRGTDLFGTSHHDASAVQCAFPSLPVGGFSCLGEIGPVCGQTRLQAFTATLGLVTWSGPGEVATA